MFNGSTDCRIIPNVRFLSMYLSIAFIAGSVVRPHIVPLITSMIIRSGWSWITLKKPASRSRLGTRRFIVIRFHSTACILSSVRLTHIAVLKDSIDCCSNSVELKLGPIIASRLILIRCARSIA